MQAFRVNFKTICIEHNYISINEIIHKFFGDTDSAKERYYSYFRKNHGRNITIDQLDFIATQLNIPTYKLIEGGNYHEQN